MVRLRKSFHEIPNSMKVEKSSQDLENEVIYSGKCTQCGSCMAFCQHMEFNQRTGEVV